MWGDIILIDHFFLGQNSLYWVTRANHKVLSNLKGRIGGQRPRPRVALLGNFKADDMEHFQRMFPTIWLAKYIDEMEELVDVREIDLIVIASGDQYAKDWPHKTHVVCFSKDVNRLPGPIPHSYLQISGEAETEEFLFPDAPLPISRRREADYRTSIELVCYID